METLNYDDYTMRPTGKPSERIPGRLVKWENSDYIEFQPQQKGCQQTRTMLRESKHVSYYRNEGKKDNSYSLHVNVSGEENDPAATIIEKVESELGPLVKKEIKVPTRVSYLADQDNLKVWHRKKDRRLCCYMELDTSLPSAVSSLLLKTAAEINKIINSNKL